MTRIGIVGRVTGQAIVAAMERAGHQVIFIGEPEQLSPRPAFCDELVYPARRKGKGERKRNRNSRWS